MDFTLACDIMVDLEGSIRPAMYLADGLAEMGYSVSIVSPFMSDVVEERLRMKGITPINLRTRLAAKNFGASLLWFEAWAREAFFRLNSRCANNFSLATVNFSQTISIPSIFWYLQGPTSAALRDMEGELLTFYRSVYRVLKNMVEYVDRKLLEGLGVKSAFVVANSNFCASLYRKWGIRVDDVIYPPIDCTTFKPSTSNPSNDYILTYFGKETKFSIVKKIADIGVKIKAFGSKAPYIPNSLVNHPNIDFMGRIFVNDLVDAYSNALFTFFPFTHEPFGYVPLESLACGTPVLTYNMQGPSEYIVNGETGWLLDGDKGLVEKAVELYAKGFPSKIRRKCVMEASKFDKKIYVGKWRKLLDLLDT